MSETTSTPLPPPENDELPPDCAAPPGMGFDDRDEFWGPDAGATTAEYAITTLAACGFAALLVVILKSGPIKELVTGVIQTALVLGGGS